MIKQIRFTPKSISLFSGNRRPYALLFLSGFAGLGYEMVWVRALSAGLGHEIVSVLAVIAAFFVGTALGAWLLDHPIRNSAFPQRWYAALETAIALWAVALSFLIPKVAPLGARVLGVEPSAFLQWGLAFLLPLVLLLPATLAMGATLPAMECVASRLQHRDSLVGGLYGANTLGAVAGTWAATFWIVPVAGFGQTQRLMAIVNIFCGLAALGLRPGPLSFRHRAAAPMGAGRRHVFRMPGLPGVPARHRPDGFPAGSLQRCGRRSDFRTPHAI